MEDVAQAVVEMELWTQLLFPWTIPSVGAVELLDPRKPSFTPILQSMLREDSRSDDDENGEGEGNLEALMREQAGSQRSYVILSHSHSCSHCNNRRFRGMCTSRFCK